MAPSHLKRKGLAENPRRGSDHRTPTWFSTPRTSVGALRTTPTSLGLEGLRPRVTESTVPGNSLELRRDGTNAPERTD